MDRPIERSSRRSLASLKCALGFRVLDGTDAKPRLVRIQPMETETIWRRTGDGAEALYELIIEEVK